MSHKPGSQPEPPRREPLRYVFSQQGHGVVAKDGYHPPTGPLRRQQPAPVGIQD